jgi:hypothetical protein
MSGGIGCDRSDPTAATIKSIKSTEAPALVAAGPKIDRLADENGGETGIIASDADVIGGSSGTIAG